MIFCATCTQAATSQSTSSAVQNAGVPSLDTLPGTEITPEQMQKYFPAPLKGTAKGMEGGAGIAPHVPVLPVKPLASPPHDGVVLPIVPKQSTTVPSFLRVAPSAPQTPALTPARSGEVVPRAPIQTNTSPTLPLVAQKNGFPPLEMMLGQMVMAGFTGTDMENDAPVLALIKQGKLGGVFLEALPPKSPQKEQMMQAPLPLMAGGQGKQGMGAGLLSASTQAQGSKIPLGVQGNIASPTQLRQLIATLQHAVPEGSSALWVAVEQEGGTVQSLRRDLGFEGLAAAASLGQGTVENTEIAARRAGIEMASLGINFVLGPAGDVNVNPLSESIGKRFRSFGPSPSQVTAHVQAFTKGLFAAKVLPCIRNFPGTGSVMQGFASSGNTTPNFLQTIPDLAASWQYGELSPYAQSSLQNYGAAIQPALIYHRGYDALYPVPLSQKVLHHVLRGQLGFRGIILSPDLRALQPFYSLQESILLAITAGVDILLVSEPAATMPLQDSFLGLGNLGALDILGQGLGDESKSDNMQELAEVLQNAKDGQQVDQTALSKALLQNSLGKFLPGAFQATVQSKSQQGIATQAELVYATLLQLVKQGRISEERVRQSWVRIRDAKHSLGLAGR